MMCVICLYIFSSVLSHLHCSNEYQSKIVMSNVSKIRDFQREKWYFCLLQTQFNMKKWKPWKINSSWRDCLFSFLFEFLPHCVWLKMIMKCKLFEILTRHLFQKNEKHFVFILKAILSMNIKRWLASSGTRLFSIITQFELDVLYCFEMNSYSIEFSQNQ